MIDLKPYGAFIENTIRPLIGESDVFINEMERLGINKQDIKHVIKGIALSHVFSVTMETIKTIICTAIIGYVAWTISR